MNRFDLKNLLIAGLLPLILLLNYQKMGWAETPVTNFIQFFTFGRNSEEPDKRGTPPSTQATGSRGKCPKTALPLMPLAGTEGYHRAISSAPTIIIYYPYDEKPFTVDLQYPNGESIIEKTISPEISGILAIQLPITLEDKDKYWWYVEVDCQSENDDSSDPSIKGQIELLSQPDRDKLEQEITSVTSPVERLKIYADHGIWYDLLNELINLGITHPDNLNYTEILSNLLTTEVWQPLLSELEQENNSDTFNRDKLLEKLHQQEIKIIIVQPE